MAVRFKKRVKSCNKQILNDCLDQVSSYEDMCCVLENKAVRQFSFQIQNRNKGFNFSTSQKMEVQNEDEKELKRKQEEEQRPKSKVFKNYFPN